MSNYSRQRTNKYRCPHSGCPFANWEKSRFDEHRAKQHLRCGSCTRHFTAEVMKLHQGHTGHKGVRR